MKLALAGVIPILILIVFIPSPASAISSVEPTMAWHLKNFINDVQETLTFNPTQKAQLKLQHAQELQDQIDQLDMQGIEIPEEVERRRLQKLGEVQNIVEGSISTARTSLQDALDKIRLVGELNDIRILHSQFANVIQNGTPQEQQDFENRVNALQTWNKYCSGVFDLDDYKPINQSWITLKQKCPDLDRWENQYGFDRIKQVAINGKY